MKKFVNWLIAKNAIRAEDAELYLYGIMNIKTVNGPTSSTSYYLHLNPTAAFKNCEAYGSIRCR